MQAVMHVQVNGCSLMRLRAPNGRSAPSEIENHFAGHIEWDVKPAFGGNKRGWFYMDAQTANMLITVYNALSEENRAKFNRIPLNRLVDFGWKHVKA
jgi:hypothetical protein